MNEILVVALGGNSITKTGQRGTFPEQLVNIRGVCRILAGLVKEGYRILLTHGNGPQVGNIMISNELSQAAVPSMPLDVCVSNTQGSLGYALQQEMANALTKEGRAVPVASIVTRVEVNPRDPAFQKPTKPVGPFFDEAAAQKMMSKTGCRMIEDGGRGWRRVVPSPSPIRILEMDSIRTLLLAGYFVIAAGGGGIPVFRNAAGEYSGVEAVVDKDLTAQQLAREVGASTLILLTGVRAVAINYGAPDQHELREVTAAKGREYQRQGHFAPGSMGPKMEAALSFVETGGGRAIIADISEIRQALRGNAGTAVLGPRMGSC